MCDKKRHPTQDAAYFRIRFQTISAKNGWARNITEKVTPNTTASSPVFQLGRMEGKSRSINRPSSQPKMVPVVLVIRSLISVARRVRSCNSSMDREKEKPNNPVQKKEIHKIINQKQKQKIQVKSLLMVKNQMKKISQQKINLMKIKNQQKIKNLINLMKIIKRQMIKD